MSSVCPSVTLVDQDHIGWKSLWKLIVLIISPTPSLFVAQRPSIYSQGTWGNSGETRGGVGKSDVLEHKSGNISETRKDGAKVTTEGLSINQSINQCFYFRPQRPIVNMKTHTHSRKHTHLNTKQINSK